VMPWAGDPVPFIDELGENVITQIAQL